ncbi:hypothetical protein B0H11DRAFT_2189380 [Mycena galericulata]|nr:hypothetical protein B0H11DRAFT_2189380 [Mycena galericulata]
MFCGQSLIVVTLWSRERLRNSFFEACGSQSRMPHAAARMRGRREEGREGLVGTGNHCIQSGNYPTLNPILNQERVRRAGSTLPTAAFLSPVGLGSSEGGREGGWGSSVAFLAATVYRTSIIGLYAVLDFGDGEGSAACARRGGRVRDDKTTPALRGADSSGTSDHRVSASSTAEMYWEGTSGWSASVESFVRPFFFREGGRLSKLSKLELEIHSIGSGMWVGIRRVWQHRGVRREAVGRAREEGSALSSLEAEAAFATTCDAADPPTPRCRARRRRRSGETQAETEVKTDASELDGIEKNTTCAELPLQVRAGVGSGLKLKLQTDSTVSRLLAPQDSRIGQLQWK